MKIVTVVLVVLLGLMVCVGAAMPEKADYKQKTQEFLDGIVKGQIEESYDGLLDDTMLATKKQAILVSKEQTKSVLKLYGGPIDYEFIKQQEYGKSVVRLVYVLRCEHLPITYEFYFYKAASEWKLVNINLTDQYDLLGDN